jgi:hypothetical protein
MGEKPQNKIRRDSADQAEFFNIHDRYEKLLDEISSDPNSGRKYRAQYLQYKKYRGKKAEPMASAIDVSRANVGGDFWDFKQLTLGQKFLLIFACLFFGYTTIKLLMTLTSA